MKNETSEPVTPPADPTSLAYFHGHILAIPKDPRRNTPLNGRLICKLDGSEPYNPVLIQALCTQYNNFEPLLEFVQRILPDLSPEHKTELENLLEWL